MNAHTERLTLQGAAGAIQALRDPAAVAVGQAPRGVAIIAHPHPLFGGTMDNKVVQTLARAFVHCGWTAVRFNFRGVGQSAGEHDHGIGEAQDFLSVVQQVAPDGPIALAGFSFGAFVHPTPRYFEVLSCNESNPSSCAFPANNAVIVFPADAQYQALS